MFYLKQQKTPPNSVQPKTIKPSPSHKPINHIQKNKLKEKLWSIVYGLWTMDYGLKTTPTPSYLQYNWCRYRFLCEILKWPF